MNLMLTVLDSDDDEPAAGVEVKIKDEDGNELGKTVTDEKGREFNRWDWYLFSRVYMLGRWIRFPLAFFFRPSDAAQLDVGRAVHRRDVRARPQRRRDGTNSHVCFFLIQFKKKIVDFIAWILCVLLLLLINYFPSEYGYDWYALKIFPFLQNLFCVASIDLRRPAKGILGRPMTGKPSQDETVSFDRAVSVELTILTSNALSNKPEGCLLYTSPSPRD